MSCSTGGGLRVPPCRKSPSGACFRRDRSDVPQGKEGFLFYANVLFASAFLAGLLFRCGKRTQGISFLPCSPFFLPRVLHFLDARLHGGDDGRRGHRARPLARGASELPDGGGAGALFSRERRSPALFPCAAGESRVARDECAFPHDALHPLRRELPVLSSISHGLPSDHLQYGERGRLRALRLARAGILPAAAACRRLPARLSPLPCASLPADAQDSACFARACFSLAAPRAFRIPRRLPVRRPPLRLRRESALAGCRRLGERGRHERRLLE